jgi:hypothetical protein
MVLIVLDPQNQNYAELTEIKLVNVQVVLVYPMNYVDT